MGVQAHKFFFGLKIEAAHFSAKHRLKMEFSYLYLSFRPSEKNLHIIGTCGVKDLVTKFSSLLLIYLLRRQRDIFACRTRGWKRV